MAAHTIICGMMYTHSTLLSSALILVGVPALVVRQTEYATRLGNLFTVGMLVMASQFMCNLFNNVVRAEFRLQCIFQFEKRRTQDILLNLLPGDIAKRMVRSSSRLPADVRRAVVLQLDLCNFTQFSQSVQPQELAAVMHRIFSKFDQALYSHGEQMHKLDTVGDAYVAAAFLPGMQWVDGPDEDLRRVGRKIRLLAAQMHRILADLRADTGYPLHARIGIGIGDVAAGVMGRLQPRFHLMGPARDSAEAHEKLAPVDGILLSEPFYLLMRGFGAVQDLPDDDSASGSDSDGSYVGDAQDEELAKLDELRKKFEMLKPTAPCVEPEGLAERFRLLRTQSSRIYRRRSSGSDCESAALTLFQAPTDVEGSDVPPCNQAGSTEREKDTGEAQTRAERGGDDKVERREWMKVRVANVQLAFTFGKPSSHNNTHILKRSEQAGSVPFSDMFICVGVSERETDACRSRQWAIV